MRAAEPFSQSDAGMTGQPSSPLQIAQTAGSEYRSGYGSIPGDEFPNAIYRTVVFAFAWMMLAAWLAFGGTAGTDLDLAIATVLFAVFLGIPLILYRTARSRMQRSDQNSKRFLESRVDIATGTISGTEAWLALAATLIGGVFAFMS